MHMTIYNVYQYFAKQININNNLNLKLKNITEKL